MGYRSDVRLKMTEKGYEVFKKYVEENAIKYVESKECQDKEYDYNLLKHLDVYKTFIEGTTRVMHFGWDYVKWYKNYADVKIIENGLDYLYENGYLYQFARIGEDMSDIEEIYNDDNYKNDICEYIDYIEITRQFFDDYMEENEEEVKND